MDITQFKYRILVPTLTRIGLDETNRISLVLGTCLKESANLTYVVQIPNGPALGFGQMEPATHADLWANYLAFRPELADKVRRLAGRTNNFEGDHPPAVSELIGNAAYAVAMVAVHYRRVPAALPPNEPYALAAYWKKYYNTALGKGDIVEALPYFTKAVAV